VLGFEYIGFDPIPFGLTALNKAPDDRTIFHWRGGWDRKTDIDRLANAIIEAIEGLFDKSGIPTISPRMENRFQSTWPASASLLMRTFAG
jgi:hypothetical protein